MDRLLAVTLTLCVGGLVAFQPPANALLARHVGELGAAFVSLVISTVIAGTLLVVAGDPSDLGRLPRPKLEYHAYEWKLRARKDRVKRLLLAVPFAAALNRRYGWFDPPTPWYDPARYDPDRRAEPGHQPTRAS